MHSRRRWSTAAETSGSQQGRPPKAKPWVNQRNVRSATIQKGGRDGQGLTPTEKFRKDQLMRQFIKGDGEKGNSKAYLENFDKIDWSKG